ncbi:MAG: carbohydrate-binding domain-containing protein [Clostridia bacterium]|nr:carbohydrate-binding domain-containing protein [Clostridia bacterium]
MKKIICAAVIAAAALFTVSCTSLLPSPGGDTVTQATIIPSSSQSATAAETGTLEDPSDDERAATGDFSITGPDGADISYSNGVYTIKTAGEYTLCGKLEGRVEVDCAGGEVTLILNGASITSSDGAPIRFVACADATVKSADETYNTVTDGRTGDASLLEGTDENDDAAIYAGSDLKISGKGTLIVASTYDNGIKSKDDLKIKNVTLKVTAPGCALKGNDSVTVESGSLILISTDSDGVKTANSGTSSKGKQQGTVTISGGTVDIYAAKDGISASYDVCIAPEQSCTVNIFTASYAGQEGTAGELYLIVPKSSYSSKKDYYAYFYNEEGGVWRKFEYETMVYSGRSASYYGLLTNVPKDTSSVSFFVVDQGADPASVVSDPTGGETVNVSMNGYLCNSASSGRISGDWVQLGSGGNSEKTAYSSKGIKAANAISIDGGAVTVQSKDDGIHANADKLESGATGAGSVTVNGGTLTLTAADDGIHADGTLCINGGTVNVLDSHEGLEANIVEINGGSTYVYGGDDGINACKGSSSPLVKITGGYLEVTTPSGDTDGIDSNGSITMTGGFVLVKGGSSSGSVAGSIDVDGSITVTGGTVIALGGICEVPGTGSVNVYGSSSTFGAGTYTIKSGDGTEIASFTLGSQYSSCWIASESLQLGGSYVIEKDGSKFAEWTQSSQQEGYVGRGGFGGGGFGPGGGGPGRR